MRTMLNYKERTKEAIIKECVEGKIKAKDAAQRLKVSVRQVENLKKKYREGISLLHGNCGKSTTKALEPEMKEKIIKRYEELKPQRVNFLHFNEVIADEGVRISYSAVRKVLIEGGFESPKKRRKQKQVHKTRDRRERFGELLQTDATPYDWFLNGKLVALHALIDDATGKLTGLHMSENECMDGYLEIMRQTLEEHGTPEAIYADGLSIFFSTKREQNITIEEELKGEYFQRTQFGNICDELGVRLIHARTSQAKGRVERLWQTLQSRLPVEFQMNNITTIEEANVFLKEKYIDKFNERFGVFLDCKSCFVKLPKNVNLDKLLCYKVSRKLDSGGCFSLKNTRFQVAGQMNNRYIEVLISKKIGVKALIDGRLYGIYPTQTRKKSIDSTDSMEMILSRFVFFFCLKNEHIA
jgi:transposase